MEDALIEKVAKAMWEVPNRLDRKSWEELTDAAASVLCSDAAKSIRICSQAAIAAVREYDSTVDRLAPAASREPIHDPDDYRHPLSLVGGSRFETGGLKS